MAESTALELLSGTDVFITNVRPGRVRRVGLDSRRSAAVNPRLVYGLITGYGRTGPDADRAAYDVAAFSARPESAHLLTLPVARLRSSGAAWATTSLGMTLRGGGRVAALVAGARTRHRSVRVASLYRQGAYTVSFDLNTA